MQKELKKAYNGYKDNALGFAWSSILYILMLSIVTLASLSLILLYIFLVPQQYLISIFSVAVVVLVTLIWLMGISGTSASLAKGYEKALKGDRIGIQEFHNYGLKRALPTFLIMLLRKLVLLIFLVPAILLSVFIGGVADYISILYGLGIAFIIFALFEPLVTTTALGKKEPIGQATSFWKENPIFILVYLGLAIIWFLNLIPAIQIVTILFAYPVVYSWVIKMINK